MRHSEFVTVLLVGLSVIRVGSDRRRPLAERQSTPVFHDTERHRGNLQSLSGDRGALDNNPANTCDDGRLFVRRPDQ